MVDVGTEPHYPCTTLHRMIATVINLRSEKTNAHSDSSLSVAFSPDGSKIVSGLSSGTIKVWASGASEATKRPSLAKTDTWWLAWQLRWISRLRRPTPTAMASPQSTSRPTEARLSPDRTTRRSKFGIRVRFGPQIAFLSPKLTLSAFPGSYAGSQEREGQRPQRLHQLGRLQQRWH